MFRFSPFWALFTLLVWSAVSRADDPRGFYSSDDFAKINHLLNAQELGLDRLSLNELLRLSDDCDREGFENLRNRLELPSTLLDIPSPLSLDSSLSPQFSGSDFFRTSCEDFRSFRDWRDEDLNYRQKVDIPQMVVSWDNAGQPWHPWNHEQLMAQLGQVPGLSQGHRNTVYLFADRLVRMAEKRNLRGEPIFQMGYRNGLSFDFYRHMQWTGGFVFSVVGAQQRLEYQIPLR